MSGPFMQGHNPRTDSFYGDDPNSDENKQWEIANKTGYIGSKGSAVDQSGVNAPASQDWSPTGQGYAISGGYMQPGTSAYDADVARQREMGAAGQGRQAAQMAHGQSYQDRTLNMGALEMLRRGAAGGMPSKAAIQGRMASDTAARSGTAAMAGARGPGQSLAAFRGASAGTAGSMGGIGAGVAEGRSAEVGRDITGYMRGGIQAHGQDIGEASTQSQLDANQRALNEQRQEGYERRAFDTRHQQQQAAVDSQKIQDASDQDWARREDAYDELERQRFNSGLGTAAPVGSSAALLMMSDERTKSCMKPLGSLSSLNKYMRK